MTSARTLEELRAVIRRLRFALESSHIGVWEHNLATNEIRWDPQMHALYQTGETAEVVRPRLWVHAIHPDDQATAIADFDAAVAARGPYASAKPAISALAPIISRRTARRPCSAPNGTSPPTCA